MANDYTTLVLLRPLLETLAIEAPAVCVRLQALHDDFADRIRRDDADLALVSEQLCTKFLPGFPRHAMYEDRFMACAWSGNPAFCQPSSLDLPAVALRAVRHRCAPNLADHALDELNVTRRIEIRTESQLLVPYLLTRTPPVAVIPERLALSAADAAQLSIAEAPVPLPGLRDAAVWHPRDSGDAAHEWQRLEHAASALRPATMPPA
ncbi:LysR substrate-binding domain-containing protein [Streptomyces sp. RP5T]|uniref:LysR substrate-binding domain-containing protein n=1 Tax=Streptomyces sp. RP5T TaxID=2490848 RepID=UPI000F652CDF|nr:LysR substrate-binding domain-containing protein [Streptomyces sp. RP5T]RRR86085.1 hypothetical protein EHS43_05755 [Streptomyces sp. RP5T]